METARRELYLEIQRYLQLRTYYEDTAIADPSPTVPFQLEVEEQTLRQSVRDYIRLVQDHVRQRRRLQNGGGDAITIDPEGDISS